MRVVIAQEYGAHDGVVQKPCELSSVEEKVQRQEDDAVVEVVLAEVGELHDLEAACWEV